MWASFIIHALFQTLSSHHGRCCGQTQCHPNWGQPKITAHFIHYVIFTAILANFLYIKGLWSSLTVSKCCGSMGVCWNQHHVLLFSLCSDGSRCLIYLFLSEASGNSVLHSSVITHLKKAEKQRYCFNEEELFDEGEQRKVWKKMMILCLWLNLPVMLWSSQTALLATQQPQADENQSLYSLHQSTETKSTCFIQSRSRLIVQNKELPHVL